MALMVTPSRLCYKPHCISPHSTLRPPWHPHWYAVVTQWHLKTSLSRLSSHLLPSCALSIFYPQMPGWDLSQDLCTSSQCSAVTTGPRKKPHCYFGLNPCHLLREVVACSVCSSRPFTVVSLQYSPGAWSRSSGGNFPYT